MEYQSKTIIYSNTYYKDTIMTVRRLCPRASVKQGTGWIK